MSEKWQEKPPGTAEEEFRAGCAAEGETFTAVLALWGLAFPFPVQFRFRGQLTAVVREALCIFHDQFVFKIWAIFDEFSQ